MFKITTNKREFNIKISDIPDKKRGGQGSSIFTIANKKLRKDEEIESIDYIEEEITN